VIKPLIHINVLLKAAFLVFTLGAYLSASTQEDTTLLPKDIEQIVEEASAEEVQTDRFQTVTSTDQVPVIERRIDTTKVAQLKNEEDFWYVNEEPPKKTKHISPNKAPADPQEQTWLRNVLWVFVVGGFIAILVWFLIASDVRLFRNVPPVSERMEEGDDLSSENIFDIDYEDALKKSIVSGNYRLAVRLLYLQTLKDLAMRNLIQYKQERTNNDYLLQLFQTSYYREFFRLTRSFEYAWYGQFPVSAAAFSSLQREFSFFKQMISF